MKRIKKHRGDPAMLENRDDKLILGLPKGSLEAATTELFAKAGYKIEISSRSLYPTINDPDIDCMLLRAQEMEQVCWKVL